MKLERMILGPLGVNTYFVMNDEETEALLIDPAEATPALMKRAKSFGKLTIVNTHGHFDHIWANAAVQEATGAPIIISETDAPMLTDAQKNLSLFYGMEVVSPAAARTIQNETETIRLGGSVFQIMMTPGHTAGGLCLYHEAEKALFSGDTIFAQSIGRTDFPGGSIASIQASIRRLITLPDDIFVYPGHGEPCLMRDFKLIAPHFLKEMPHGFYS